VGEEESLRDTERERKVTYPLELSEVKKIHVVRRHHLESGNIIPPICQKCIHMILQNPISHKLWQLKGCHIDLSLSLSLSLFNNTPTTLSIKKLTLETQNPTKNKNKKTNTQIKTTTACCSMLC
jgi:hypothetical protein